MSLIIELQRRNVIRVAIAYLAGAWLLIQIADTLLPIYGFVDSAIRIVVGMLVIGFIPAVILAWVFELTPEGLKRESEIDRSRSITRAADKKLDRVIIVVLALALVYFTFDKLVLSESRIESARLKGRAEALVESYGDKSIAVLPFADMSAAGDQEYMSDGIAEELLNLLSKVPELRVISRSSAFSFKGKGVDIPTIASRLNVANILEGSVRKAGNTIRITAQLIDARSDSHVWSETYDRELIDIFAIQDEIAATVVGELKVALLGNAPTVAETDPVAYEAFLQARLFHEQPTLGNLQKARELYEAALAIDERYVRAWAWLAALQSDLAVVGAVTSEEARLLARDSIERALEIDPNDPMAVGIDGLTLVEHDRALAAGTKKLQQALELEPTNLMILRWTANALYSLGRFDAAATVMEYLFARDPLGYITRANLIQAYLNGGRFDDAIELGRTSLELFPDDEFFPVFRTISLLHSGDAQGAVETAMHIVPPAERLSILAVAYFELSQQAQFESALTELLDLARIDSAAATSVAYVYAQVDDIDAAFDWLERARESGVWELSPNDIFYSGLHDDARWDVLMERVGMSQAALDAIEFEVKLPN
jgi:TolB-like protein/Tfp pilus assembly protein PilF